MILILFLLLFILIHHKLFLQLTVIYGIMLHYILFHLVVTASGLFLVAVIGEDEIVFVYFS
jgi:hypothetical protein